MSLFRQIWTALNSDAVRSLNRSGLPQTQNYCLQAFFNMAHNEDFAKAIAKSHLMEAFIIGCMGHTTRQATNRSNPVSFLRRSCTNRSNLVSFLRRSCETRHLPSLVDTARTYYGCCINTCTGLACSRGGEDSAQHRDEAGTRQKTKYKYRIIPVEKAP